MEVLLLRSGGVPGGCLPRFYRLVYLESQASRHGELDGTSSASCVRRSSTPGFLAYAIRREDDPEAETRASVGNPTDAAAYIVNNEDVWYGPSGLTLDASGTFPGSTEEMAAALQGLCSPHGRATQGYRPLAKNVDRNAVAVAADVFAVKVVVAQVLGRIHQLDPILAGAIECGFEDAVSAMRALGTSARKGTGANNIVRAIATIESLQVAALERSRVRDRVRREVANDNS